MLESRGERVFYGYIIVLAGFIISSVMWSVHYSFGIFFKELANEFHLSRAVTSGIWSTSNLTYGFASILMGKLTDKLGPRVIITGCGILFGLGYALVSQASMVWQIYLLLGLMAGVGLGAAFVPLMSTVARWFVKRRGVATGIVASGAPLGGLLGPIIANWLISTFNWRMAYLVLGLTVLLLIVLLGQFLRRDPRDVNQTAYGVQAMKINGEEEKREGLSFNKVFSLNQFWWTLGAWFCFGVFINSVIVHLVPHITDIGISVAAAAGILAALGGVGIISRIFMGIVSDRIGSRLSMTVGMSPIMIGLVLLLFSREIWLFYLMVIFFGFGYGSGGSLISLFLADLFGKKTHGVVLGLIVASWGLGSFIGPILVGYLFDITGSYQTSFMLCLLLSAVTLSIFVLLKPTPHQKELARG
ncbi:nitrate/nitrite transporter [Chloroflexota bacterium]